MHATKIIFVFVSTIVALSGCGLADTDECANPHPSMKAECDAREKSTDWDDMKWDEGTWG